MKVEREEIEKQLNDTFTENNKTNLKLFCRLVVQWMTKSLQVSKFLAKTKFSRICEQEVHTFRCRQTGWWVRYLGGIEKEPPPQEFFLKTC